MACKYSFFEEGRALLFIFPLFLCQKAFLGLIKPIFIISAQSTSITLP